MRRAIPFLASLVCLFAVGCLQVDEPAPPPQELPAEILFSTANLPPAVEIPDATLHTAKNSVIADFNLDGLDDVAIVETYETPTPAAEPGTADAKPVRVTPLKAPEVTVYIRAKADNDATTGDVKMYHKAGAIPSVSGKLVAGLASRKSSQYTDLVILFRDDGDGTEMVHYQNKGDRFVRIEEVHTEPTPQP